MTQEVLSPNHRWRNGCTYCGAVHDITRDHVIPTSYLRTKRSFRGDWLVPACHNCNVLLGDELIFNVPDRAAWVRTAIRRKYRRQLEIVVWDEDEIADLGDNLASMVKLAMAQRDEFERRLVHLELVASQPINYMTGSRPYIAPEHEEVLEHIDPEVADAYRRAEVIRRAEKRYPRGK